MRPCDSPLSHLLDFLTRRLDQSRPPDVICDAETLDSLKIFRDYVIREINLLLWFSLFVITGLLLRKFFVLFRLWRCGCQIPGPPSPSFYGHSMLFTGADPQNSLNELLLMSHKKYGSIIKLWLSPTELLVSIKEPSLLKEMLSKAADKLPLTGRVYQLAFGPSSLFVSPFEKVKRGRESLALELNGKFIDKVNLRADRVLDSVMERICNNMDKVTLNCGLFSQHIAFSIMGAMLFGDTFFTWSKGNDYEELMMRITKDACFWASYSVPPFWKQGYWKYQQLCTKLKSLTQDIVQQCWINCKLLCQWSSNNTVTVEVEAGLNVGYSDEMAKLMKSSPQELFDHLNVWDQPCGNVMGLMFHGCLTSTALIGNILERLVMHPEIQEKIYTEIIVARRQSKKVNKQDVSDMHLLLATIYESARLLPTRPLLQRCSLNHDMELKNGLNVPAGSILVAPIQLVHEDKSNWGSDAREFNPYRFLSKAENMSEVGRSSTDTGAPRVPADSYILCDPFNNTAFLPFGSGIRACVGQKFTVLGVASVFASLLERYEIKSAPISGIEPRPLMKICALQLFPSPNIRLVLRST